jgi:hypothetical protein
MPTTSRVPFLSFKGTDMIHLCILYPCDPLHATLSLLKANDANHIRRLIIYVLIVLFADLD